MNQPQSLADRYREHMDEVITTLANQRETCAKLVAQRNTLLEWAIKEVDKKRAHAATFYSATNDAPTAEQLDELKALHSEIDADIKMLMANGGVA